MTDIDQLSSAIGGLQADNDTAKRHREETSRKLDELLASMARTEQHLRTLNGKVASHEKEIASLTRVKYYAMGIAAGVGGIGATIADHIRKVF